MDEEKEETGFLDWSIEEFDQEIEDSFEMFELEEE